MKPISPMLVLTAAVLVLQATAEPAPVPEIAVVPIPKQVNAIVSSDKNSRFKTLQEAVDAAPENATEPFVILIKPGRYRWEQTLIPQSKPFIHLVGENPSTTTLSYHLNVYETRKDRILQGREGITLAVDSDHFKATNLTIENTSGDHGQALAMRIDGDKAVVSNCRLLGWQDTLMVNKGRQYFRDCYIEGRVDFIYGDATAVFENCEIRSKNGGYVTAASTPENQEFGLVFRHCKLTGDPTPWEVGKPEKSPPQAFLGRPWRPFAQVAFIQCEMGAHIKPEGWNNWGKPNNEKTARYFESGSTGPGASPKTRVPWAGTLAEKDAGKWTAEAILAGSDGWIPTR